MADLRTMVHRVSDRLTKAMRDFYKIFPDPVKKDTGKEKKTQHPGSKNHGKGETKKRRKMATMSNRINRSRDKKWKYN